VLGDGGEIAVFSVSALAISAAALCRLLKRNG